MIPRKSIWYHPYRQSFIAELGNIEPFPGTTLTPRDIVTASLEYNLKAIKEMLHANTVCFRVQDDDSFAHQYGGGFSYDPVARPSPACAEALEIMVSTAHKHGLKVIVDIDFSSFHRWENDMWGTDGHGLYDYIHSVINPSRYYGPKYVNYIGDPRIQGWIFCADGWQLSFKKQSDFVSKYWDFSYDCVHSGGANTAWLGIYINAGPHAGRPDTLDRVVDFKRMFSPIGPNKQPDMFGMCWYGEPVLTQSPPAPWNDLHVMTDYFLTQNYGHARGPTYGVPANRVFLMEGGCSATLGTPGIMDFYAYAISAADNKHITGINVWADTTYHCNFNQSGPSSDDVGPDKKLALFNCTHTKTGYVRTFPKPLSPGWHGVRAPWSVSQDVWPVACDYWKVESLTDVGKAVMKAFDGH